MAVVLVALGGAIGCLARTGLESALGEWNALALGQVLANISGAFGLGLLSGFLTSSRSAYAAHASLLLGTGLMGGWTTYSGLAMQSLSTAEESGTAAGALVLAGSVLLGLVAAVAGLRVGVRRPRHEVPT